MAIETYLLEENADVITDVELNEEWHQKVSELELEGQKKIVSPGKSPIPFPFMNENMLKVYSELCPVKDKVQNYQMSAIPLKALSLIALSQKEMYFDYIEIWHSNTKPDPIAVGSLIPEADKTKTWNAQKYIIARWGDELESFPELAKKAMDIWKQRTLLKCREKFVEMEDMIKNIDIRAESYFNNGKNFYF